MPSSSLMEDNWATATHKKSKPKPIALVSAGPRHGAGGQVTGQNTSVGDSVARNISGGLAAAAAQRYNNPEKQHFSYQLNVPDEVYYRAFQKIGKDSITNVVTLRFHKTDIVKIKPNGDVILDTGKYYTYTTLCSMNDALQFIDMKVKVMGEVRDPDNWVVSGAGALSMPYSDHMVIPAKLPSDVDRGLEVLTGMRALLASTTEANTEKLRSGPPPPRAPLTVPPSSAAPAAPRAPMLPATPPPVIVPPAGGAAAPIAAGSAWAARGSLAAKLAAESEFPPLGAAAKPAGAAAAAAKPAARVGGASAGAKAVPAAAAAAAQPAPAAAGEQAAPAPPAPAAAAAAEAPALAPPAAAGFSPAHSPAPLAPPAPYAPMPLAPAHHASPPHMQPSLYHNFPANGACSPVPVQQQAYLPESLDDCYAAGAGRVMPGLAHSPSPLMSSTTSSLSGVFSPASMAQQPHQQACLAPAHQPSKAVAALFAMPDGGASADDGSLCCVCMHHKCDTVLVPCSHAILCRSCADVVMNLTPGSSADVPECPLCRSPIDLVLDIAC